MVTALSVEYAARDAVRQGREGQGKAPLPSEPRRRGYAAVRRSVQKRAAIQRELDGSGEPQKDRSPDLGDFGPG